MQPNLSKVSIALARLENNRAAAPFSRSGVPRPVRTGDTARISGWNLPPAPEHRRAEILGDSTLTAASEARLRRLQTLELGSQAALPPAAPAERFETERKIPMSFAPPRWETKTLKAGPRKGQTVTQEVKWMLHLITRQVGPYTATARLKKDGIVPPTSAGGGKAFATVWQDLSRRWPADAAALTEFLSFRDIRDEWAPA